MRNFCCGLMLAWLACAAHAQTPLIAIETSLPSAPYASFSLASDSASFAPDSAENKDLVEKGFGLPVRVRQRRDGYVLVHATSPRVLVPVPFGWRGFDDGKRTRLFAPSANIGMVINATRLDDAQSWDETREQVWKFARETATQRAKKDARYSARLIRLDDGTFGMREAKIYEAQGDPYSSVILFRQHPDDPRTAIRLNLFAPVGDFDRYLALAALVMKDLQGARIPVGLDTDLSNLPQ